MPSGQLTKAPVPAAFPGLQEWGNPAEKEYYDYMKSYRCSGEGA